MVTNGAVIAVVAREAIVGRRQGADSSRRCTGRLEAGGVRTRRCVGAGDDRSRFDNAFKGPIGEVANESAVAKVAIFQTFAVNVRLAIAGDCRALALKVFAAVRDGTGIIVITIRLVGLSQTTSQPVTGIVCAGVAIVTIDGLANADARFAVVANGADVAIFALTFSQFFMATTIFPVTEVESALVAVVAKRHSIACNVVRLVR